MKRAARVAAASLALGLAAGGWAQGDRPPPGQLLIGSRTLTRLSGHYGCCLHAGRSLTVSRVSLRSALADQLYRRALAAAGSAQP